MESDIVLLIVLITIVFIAGYFLAFLGASSKVASLIKEISYLRNQVAQKTDMINEITSNKIGGNYGKR